MKTAIIVILILLLQIPIHELGHYITAKADGVHIHEFNGFPRYKGTSLVNPYVMTKTQFSSTKMLILCYLSGFLITFIPALIISIALYVKGTRLWWYSFSWLLSAPFLSLGDFNQIMGLL